MNRERIEELAELAFQQFATGPIHATPTTVADAIRTAVREALDAAATVVENTEPSYASYAQCFLGLANAVRELRDELTDVTAIPTPDR